MSQFITVGTAITLRVLQKVSAGAPASSRLNLEKVSPIIAGLKMGADHQVVAIVQGRSSGVDRTGGVGSGIRDSCYKIARGRHANDSVSDQGYW